MTNYQNYDAIEEALIKRVADFTIQDPHAWTLLVASTWNVLRRVDCKDSATYETIINGMGNAYNAGATAIADHKYWEECANETWDG